MIKNLIQRGFGYFIQQSGATFSLCASFIVSIFTLTLLSSPYGLAMPLPIAPTITAIYLIHAFIFSPHFLQNDLENGVLAYARLGRHSEMKMLISYTLNYLLWMLLPLCLIAIVSLPLFPNAEILMSPQLTLLIFLFIVLLAKVVALIATLSAPLKKNNFLAVLWGIPLCLPGIFFTLSGHELIISGQSAMNMILLLFALNIFYAVLAFLIGPIALRYAVNSQF